MAIAKRVKEFTYVLTDDRELPAEQQTEFLLKTLTFKEAEELNTVELTPDAHLVSRPLAKARRALNLGLLGWRKFRDGEGTEVAFREAKSDGGRVIPDELLDLLRPSWAMELAEAIRNEASLDLDTAKNC